MDLGLADRVYLVTGASSGLGRATAEVLVAEGARVVLSSRAREAVDAAVAALGVQAVGVAADNADPATPERLVAATASRRSSAGWRPSCSRPRRRTSPGR